MRSLVGSDKVMMMERVQELLMCLAELAYSCLVQGRMVSKVRAGMAGRE